MRSLTLAEARERAALLTVTSYAVELDLDQGAEVFGSLTTVRFTCSSPGADSWVDLKARSVETLRLNGIDLDPATVVEGRLPLTGLAADNELVVAATMAYSHDGQGLHRATDPADQRDYVYGHLFLDAAPSVYACFDQPDLKAPYDVVVRAPLGWTVIGNGAATETAPGTWQLETTKPLATYFVTVCAGPYVSVHDEHDGIPLGIHARASLREPLERHAAEIFDVTKRSFDYFHGLFGIRYPFGEYHQVFVPEFNAGAMENPGCVTFRDQYLYRGSATRDELLTRANTISHEMSHMWFGDLVTMKWWDDLWLNESFAEYMSHRCLVEATEYADAWVDSSIVRKVWGYGAERSPSTHPVAGVEALDAQSALQNFDGISYAKGAAALRQLIAHVGDDQFIAGVRAYLTDKSYANGTLADFLGAIETASGADLDAWSRSWLLTADRDTLWVSLAERGDVVESASVERETPADRPADRPHTFDVAGWTDGQEVARVTTTVTAATTPLEALEGAPAPAVVVPNASDLTWARVVLSERTLAALPSQLAAGARPAGARRRLERAHRRRARRRGVARHLPRRRRGRLAPGDQLLDPHPGLGLRRAPHRALLRAARAPGRRARPTGGEWSGPARVGAGGQHRVPRGRPPRGRGQRRRGPAAGVGRRRTRCRPVCRTTATSAGSSCATSPRAASSTSPASSPTAPRTTRSRAASTRSCAVPRCPTRRRRTGPGSS